MVEKQMQEARRQRLRDAITEVFAGKNSLLGRKLGYKDGAFVRQMLAGERAVSDKTIRALESSDPRLQGWFDTAPSQRARDEDLAHSCQIPPADPAALLHALAAHLSQVDPAHRAELGDLVKAWVSSGGKPSYSQLIADYLEPRAQETPRKAA